MAQKFSNFFSLGGTNDSNFGSIQRSCSSKKLFHTSYFAGDCFLLLAGRARTGWHSNTVICCYRNSSISYVIDICNYVRLDTGALVIFEYFWGPVVLEIFRKLLSNYLKKIKYYSLPSERLKVT